ncbi:MAG: hypothetical protein GY798_27010 [Hyphomicrobiales bacterium]|nr:hypothetical protein [Hyphomicrobiales bacterium]
MPKGATKEELVELVRGTQEQLLFHICYLIDGPDFGPDYALVGDMYWGLFELDEQGRPLRQIDALQESVYDPGLSKPR